MVASAQRIEQAPRPAPRRPIARPDPTRDTFQPARTRPAQQLLGGAGRLSGSEVAARGAVQLHSAATQRAQAQRALGAQQTELHQWVSQAFDKARPGKRLPPGMTGHVAEDGRAVELVQRAKNGDVLSQVTATRNGSELSLSSVSYGADGKASLSQWWSGSQGVSSATASWKEARSKTPATVLLASLQSSRDLNVEVSESATWRTGAALSSRVYQQGPSGVQSSTTTYGSQANTDGIHGELAGQFRKGSIDTARTETVLLPAAAGKATIVDSAAYAQGGVQATSAQVTQAPWKPQAPPNAADLDMLRIARSDDPGGNFKTGAKQWTLEKSNGVDSYSAQTFVEGSSASTVTRVHASGASVTTTLSGTTLDAHGKTVPVRGQSRETFLPDGSIASLSQSRTDPGGNTTLESYRRSDRMTPQGLDVTETLDAETVNTNCQISRLSRRTESRYGAQGPELLSTSETLSAPGAGRVAVVDGQPVNPAALTAAQRPLALQGQIDAAKQAKGFLNKGLKNAVILAAEKNGAAAGAVGIAGSVAGLVSGVDSLEQAVRSQNLPKIASSVISSGLAAKNIGTGAYGLYRALAGAPTKAAGVTAALRVAGALDNVPGVSVDAATALGIGVGKALGFAGPAAQAFFGGKQLYQGIESGNGNAIAQGSVGLAGAGAGAIIAEAASVGAIGGPEGLLAGAAVGVVTYGVQQLIGLFEPDTSHDIAPVKI